MVILGITGGIGSGKTAVLSILKEQYGAYIIEADQLAHQLMEPGHDTYDRIVAHFGTEILLSDGTIDRKLLGQRVFSDKEQLAVLNNITHPAVKEEIKKQIEVQKGDNCKLFVIEAALLLQDGYKEICDELWYIYADLDVRIHRLCTYRSFTEERAMHVIQSQECEAFYRQGCDFVLNNSGTLHDTEVQIREKLYQ